VALESGDKRNHLANANVGGTGASQVRE